MRFARSDKSALRRARRQFFGNDNFNPVESPLEMVGGDSRGIPLQN